MRALRSRLTYANVISTLCLFMLLGGGAYAATQLPKNSVGAKQIKNGAVTGKEIKKGTIDTSKLAPSAIATLKGVGGPVGPVGPQGAQGPQGLTNGGAHATVGVEEEDPTFVGSHPGFAAVERFPDEGNETLRGIYCLTPTSGTDITHPLASTDFAGSGGGRGRFVEPLADGVVLACEEGQLEVRTFELFQEENPGETEEEIADNPWIRVPSNALAFTVFAPGT